MIFKLALRNIFRQKRRTVLTIMMMCFGYTLLAFTYALSEGSYNSIIEAFTSQSTGHLQIHNKSYLENQNLFYSITDAPKMIQNLERDKSIKAVSARITGGALAFANNKTAGVKIVGFNALKEQALTHYENRVFEKDSTINGPSGTYVYIGKKVARILKLKLGDSLAMISSGVDGSIANDLYTVKGIMKGSPFDDNSVYLGLNAAQEFFSLHNQVTHVSVLLHNIGSFPAAVNRMAPLLSNTKYIVRPWQKIESSFYKAMEADKKGNTITELIIVLMVSIGVLNTILMSMLERTREFGLLKALGTKPLQLAGMVTLEVLLTSFISLAIGVVLAYAVIYYFSIFGIQYSEPMTYGGMTFSELTVEFSTKAFLRPAVVILLSSALVALVPSYRVLKLKPIDGLKDF